MTQRFNYSHLIIRVDGSVCVHTTLSLSLSQLTCTSATMSSAWTLEKFNGNICGGGSYYTGTGTSLVCDSGILVDCRNENPTASTTTTTTTAAPNTPASTTTTTTTSAPSTGTTTTTTPTTTAAT